MVVVLFRLLSGYFCPRLGESTGQDMFVSYYLCKMTTKQRVKWRFGQLPMARGENLLNWNIFTVPGGQIYLNSEISEMKRQGCIDCLS